MPSALHRKTDRAVIGLLQGANAVFRFALLGQRSARNGAWSILKTGIPSAVQVAVFCFANIFVQASVNASAQMQLPEAR